MPSEKTLALVLRVVEFSETSCIVTLFTREFGKIGALAKGARRPKSPFESALDLLALCRIVFLHKSSDALDLLTEARLERRFRSASRDLTRLYAGYYVAELLCELTHTGDPHPELFDAADTTLAGLDGDADVGMLVLRFEVTALRLLGHLPVLDACAACGEAVALEGTLRFGLLAGGLLCARCRPGQRQVVQLRPSVVRTLQRFADGDAEKWQAVPLDPAEKGQLRGLLHHYLAHLLGKRPKMHAFL
jgi:DNA repair protein RecO (recombination protein O)